MKEILTLQNEELAKKDDDGFDIEATLEDLSDLNAKCIF